MEIIGIIKTKLIRTFKEGTQINKEIFIKGGLSKEIKEKFNFSVFNEPIDPSKELLTFSGGTFTYKDTNYSIEELNIGQIGIYLTIITKDDVALNCMNNIVSIMEESGVANKSLLHNIREDSYVTNITAKLDISPYNFISEKFMNALKRVTETFSKKLFTTEIHPFTFGASIILKPNLQEISKMSLNTAEISDLMGNIETKDIVLYLQGPANFYERIYTLRIEADFKTTIKILEFLESNLS